MSHTQKLWILDFFEIIHYVVESFHPDAHSKMNKLFTTMLLYLLYFFG